MRSRILCCEEVILKDTVLTYRLQGTLIEIGLRANVYAMSGSLPHVKGYEGDATPCHCTRSDRDSQSCNMEKGGSQRAKLPCKTKKERRLPSLLPLSSMLTST